MQVEGGLLAIACAKIANLDVPAFVKDSELKFVAVNAAFEAFCGFDQTALVGHTMSSLTDRPEDRALEDMECRVLVFTEEQIALCFDETGREHCRVQIERFITEDEKLFVFGVFRERPRRLKARVAKKKPQPLAVSVPVAVQATPVIPDSYEDFRGLLDALPLGLLLLDAARRIVHFNGALACMLAPLADALRVGVEYHDLAQAIGAHCPNHRENRQADHCQRLRNLPELENTLPLRISLGDKVIEVCRKPFAQSCILLLFSDVTAAQAAERESRLYRSVLENVPEPVFLRDSERRLVFANDAYEQMLGSDRTRFYGMREDEMFPQADDRMRLDNLSVLETGQEVEREQVVRMPNGVDVPVLTSLKRIEDTEGARYIVGTLADVSILKVREREIVNAQLAAEAADRAKSHFLASMGHEIRTPMSGVLGMAELLSASALDARQRTFLDVIIKSGRSLLTIINDILDFARIDDQSLSLRKAPFDPAAAVDDVILLMAGRAAEKDIDLLVRGKDRFHHMVAGDAGRFRQILTKLLDEAIKATDKGYVLVELSERKENDERVWLTLRIEDTGRGFTEEQKSLAFTKFSQFENAPLHHKASAGLSLSIVAGLVELFGGTIAIDSEVDQGCVITVCLPLEIVSEKLPDRPAPHLQGARVLALACNALTCDILNGQLSHWGFDGVALGEPDLAYTVLREASRVGQPIELLIVEVQRDDDEALHLVKRLRDDGLFRHLSVIAIVSANMMDVEAKLESLNIQVYLQKPVVETSLRSAIADVLRAVRRDMLMEPQGRESLPHNGIDSRVLIVDADETECDFFRQALTSEGLSCEIFSNEEQAFAAWQRARPRLMLIDCSQNGRTALDFARFVRLEEARTPDVEPTVLIGLCGLVSAQVRAAYLADGLDDLLVKPISRSRLLAKVMECMSEGPLQDQLKQRLAL